MIRRYLSAFLLVHGLALAAPATSFAYDWYWIDALSGPAFGGLTFEWRAYCQKEDRYNKRTRVALDKLGAVLKRAGNGSEYERLLKQLDDEDWNGARATLNGLLKTLGSPLTVATLEPAAFSRNETTGTVERAVWDIYKDTLEPELSDAPGFKRMTVPPITALISICTYEPRETRKASLNILVGLLAERYDEDFFAKPYKKYVSEADDPTQNRLFIVQPSYSIRVNDFLDVAAGAGVAIFSSRRQESFTRLIVEPARVDWRPLNFNWSNSTMKVIGEVITLRGGFFIFPQGFAPNAFHDEDPRIPAELVKYAGLVFDTEPILRKLRPARR
jgi:hypothetical protein